MNKKKNTWLLFEALGNAKDEYIKEMMPTENEEYVSENKLAEESLIPLRRRKGLIAAAAAAAVLAVSTVLLLHVVGIPNIAVPEDAVQMSENEPKTSESYDNLEELLQHLMSNENHSTDEMGNGRNAAVSVEAGYLSAASAVVDNGYSYHISQGGVSITKLYEKEKNMENRLVNVLAAHGEKLIAADGVLAVIGTEYDESDPLGGKPTVAAELYDVSDPSSPVKIERYTQSGALVDCYLQNGKIGIITSDGVCACGYSRESDISDYMPKIASKDESFGLAEEDIYILGEPTSVKYITLSVFDIAQGKITAAKAFYGDAVQIFSDFGRLAVCVESRGRNFITAPVMYVFDTENEIRFSGSVYLSAALDIPAVWGRDGGKERAEVIYAELCGDVCNMICTVVCGEGDAACSYISAISADMSSGECRIASSSAYNSVISIDEIIRNGTERLIISSSFDINTFESKAWFSAVDFESGTLSVAESGCTVDVVNGVDMMFSYGKPYGEIFPTMVLKNDIAIRYNSIPNGMDIFDISDAENIKCLYSSGNMFNDDEDRFMLCGKVLDENKIAVLSVSPCSNEHGETDYRLLESSISIYLVDPHAEVPFTLLSGINAGSCNNVEFLSYNGTWYFVEADYAAPDTAAVTIS